MHNLMTEAVARGGLASKNEIYTGLNEGYDVIHTIVSKSTGFTGSLADNIALVICFVHPEVSLPEDTQSVATGYRHTYDSILRSYAKQVPVKGKLDEKSLAYAGQPMVNLLNDLSGAVWHSIANAMPRGEYEDDESSSFGSRRLAEISDSIRENILENDRYTTESYISSKVNKSTKTGEDETRKMERLLGEIDMNSLFGFRREDVTNGEGGDDAWKTLEYLEHWYYALLSIASVSRQDSVAETGDVAESVHDYVDGLRKLVADPDAAAVFRLLEDTLTDVKVNGMGDAANDELRVKRSLSQLAVLVTLFGNLKVSDIPGLPANATLYQYMALLASDEKYKDGLQKISDFMKVNYKAGVRQWKVDELRKAVAENDPDGTNPVTDGMMSILSTNLKARSSIISDAVNKLMTQHLPRDKQTGKSNLTKKGYTPLICALGSMVDGGSVDTPDKNPESVLVGKGGANVNKASSPLSLLSGILKTLVGRETYNFVTQPKYDTAVIDPYGDVNGAYILPKMSIPLFSVEMRLMSSGNGLDQQLSNLAAVMVGYMAIAYSGQDIDPMPWFKRRVDEYKDENTGEIVRDIGISVDDSKKVNTADILHVVQDYINRIGTSGNDVANVVNLRNSWVDVLTENESWSQIAATVSDYITELVEGMPENNRFTADDKTALLGNISKIIADAKDHVARRWFNIKKDAYDYEVRPGLTALMVYPYPLVNKPEYGRLRQTGGGEGTVTDSGKALLNATMGRVTGTSSKNMLNAKTREDEKVITYSASFENLASGLKPCKFTSKMLDTWLPNKLIQVPDSDANDMQYGLWLGVEFVDYQTDEDRAGTFKVSGEEVKASDAEYQDSVVGTHGYTDLNGSEELKNVGKILNTVSGPAVGAVRRIGDILWKAPSSDFDRICQMLKFAQKPELAEERMFDEAIKVEHIVSTNSMGAANDIFDAIARKFYATKMTLDAENFICDIGSMEALHKILGLCNPGLLKTDKETAVRRMISVLDVLPDVSEAPFDVVASDGDRISLDNTGEDIPVVDEANRMAYGQAVEALREESMTLRDAAAGNGNLDEEYMAAYGMLAKISGILDRSFADSLAVPAQGIQKGRQMRAAANIDSSICKYSSVLANPDSRKLLADRLQMIRSELRSAPELFSMPITDVLDATLSARKVPGELSVGRVPDAEKRQVSGKGRKIRMVGGDGYEDILTPDYNGEYDDLSGCMVSSSIDMDKLAEFDAAGDITDYAGISEAYPMLGMVMCDADGNHTALGHLSTFTGINPRELDEFARALDSAHESVLSKTGGHTGGHNVAIGNYIADKDYIYEQAIDAFYGFIASPKRISSRNLMRDATDVNKKLLAVINHCTDVNAEEALDTANKAYTDALDEVKKHIGGDEGATNDEYIVQFAARVLSTAIANIVLYLNDYVKIATPTDNPDGLEVYGQSAVDGPGKGEEFANRYTTMASVNPYVEKDGDTSKKVLARAKTALTKETSKQVRSSVYDAIKNGERYAATLTSIYDVLGKGNKLGYEGAISPFDDLVEKSNSKYTESFDELYGKEARTDLGAALVYAIVSDETAKNGTYYILGRYLSCLISVENGQMPITLPKYVISGIELKTQGRGQDKQTELNFNSTVQVVFNDDGSAVLDNKGMPIGEGAQPFQGLGAVGKAIRVPLENGDTVDDVARKIRMSVVDRRMADNQALKDMARENASTTNPVNSDTMDRFVKTMERAAASTMSDMKTFVPLAVLYTCLDDDVLNTAKAVSFDTAKDVLNSRTRTNADIRTMKSLYGNQYGEVPDLGQMAEANTDMLQKAFAAALTYMKASTESPSVRMRKAIAVPVVNDVDGEQVEVPDSSLRDMLGADRAAESMNIMLQQISPNMFADIDEDFIDEFTTNFVDRIKASGASADFGKPLSKLADILVSLTSGEVDMNDAVSDINTVLGATTDTVAVKLIKEYVGKLGVSNMSAVSKARMRYAAQQTVYDSLSREGEFRILYMEKYGDAKLAEQQARRVMRGTSNLFGTEPINGASGLEKMYSMVQDALDGTMDYDDAIRVLKGIRFSISSNSERGQALADFNSLYGYLKKRLSGLMKVTSDGISAQISVISGNESDDIKNKRNALACGDSPLDDEHCGARRKSAIAGVKTIIDRIKDAMSTRATESIQIFDDALNVFLEKHCMWNRDMEKDELVAAKARATGLGNKELESDYVTLKTEMAKAFSRSKACYMGHTISAVGVGSAHTGINTDYVLSGSVVTKILNRMNDIPSAPIHEYDSPMFSDEYIIDDIPVDKDHCSDILNAALEKYGVPEGGVTTDEDIKALMNADFFACVRRCARDNRDLAIAPGFITELVINTLLNEQFMSTSPYTGYVRARYQFDNVFFVFDVPVSIIRELTTDKMQTIGKNNSLNEWKAFADEVSKYTAEGNRINQANLVNEEMGNKLLDVVNKVVDSLKSKFNTFMTTLGDEKLDDLKNDPAGIVTPDGMHVVRAKIANGRSFGGKVKPTRGRMARDIVRLPGRLTGAAREIPDDFDEPEPVIEEDEETPEEDL